MKIGDKVKYQKGDQELTGVIHGIKRGDLGKGEVILGYLIDTGKDERVYEFVTEGKKDNIFERQPEQVEVLPQNIKPVE